MNNITHEWIKTGDLKIERYNRTIDYAYAKRIAAEFDVMKCGVPIISERNGVYYIMDGQHRIWGANAAGIESIFCAVHHGLTYEQEAALFVSVNSNRKMLFAYDYIRGLHESGDPDVKAIYNIAGLAGMTISKTSGRNKITAVRAVMSVCKKYGKDNLAECLMVLRDAWGGDKDAIKGDMIEGVSILLAAFGTSIDKDRLSEKIKAIAPTRIFCEADSDPSGDTKRVKIARALLRHYNSRLQNKLPDLIK